VSVERVSLSKEEGELAEQIAKQFGLTVEEATTLVVKACIARRMKKRTGKNPAKVYGIRAR
jgi:ribosomal protein L23